MVQILKQMALLFLLHTLLINVTLAQQEKTSQGICIVRDGRDGAPGPPGPAGRPGSHGRDGRDCTINWSLNKVFEMEKRLRKLDSKCEFVVKEAEQMRKELGTSKQQTQQLLRILTAKKILDSDALVEQTTYDIIALTPDEPLTQPNIVQSTQEPEKLPSPVFFTTPEPTASQSCNKRLAFHVHDKIETRGAVDIEVFTIENNTFLAVGNFHLSQTGYNTDSFIYKMNPNTEKFEILQTLPTIGCRSMTYFSDSGDSYLVVANHFDGSTHALDSIIYKWNGSEFVNYTKIKTHGASAAQFFKINGESFLAFANYRNNTSVSIFSIIYKWDKGKLQVFQKLPTHGAVDCKFHRSKEGQIFLVFANYYRLGEGFDVKSVVYKWDEGRFVFAQNVIASAAMSVDLFESDEGLFLALASHRTANTWHSDTNVYRWNGTSFVLFQELETTAAIKVNHFIADGKLYLTIANYFDEITNFKTHSMVYEYKNNRFVKFQGISTMGAYDLQPYSYRGATYLAAAFRFDGKHGALKSKIYKMYKGCLAREDALP